VSEQKIRKYFGATWLPVYLLVGVSWLFAPALAHEHYGTLRLISNEEASGLGVSLWFRLNDIAAALLLLLAVYTFQIGRHSRWFGRALLASALLAAIDGLFPDTCYIGHAVGGTQAAWISGVHDVETIMLTGVVAMLSVVDAVRHRRTASIGFVALQLFAVLSYGTGYASHQFMVLLQYTYETALILWLGWIIDRFNPIAPAIGHERLVRRVVGAWVVAAGIFALVTAIPRVHFIGEFAFGRTPIGLLLAQHGIVTGVLTLYLARHLLRGERPALWLTVLLFYSEIIKYSLLTPQPVGLLVYTLLLALLVYARHGFDRNTQPPSWFSRLADVGVVLGGLLLAAAVILGLITLSGERTRFAHDVQRMYSAPAQALDRHEPKIGEHREARLRTLTQTLAISVGAVTLWSLFRPKSLRSTAANHCSRSEATLLLERFGNSSEDFFKLWPADKAYFCIPGVQGAIAYREEAGIAFVLADPIAGTKADKMKLLKAFASFAREHGWVLSVLIVGGTSTELYKRLGLQIRQIGSSAVIDIATFNTETARSKWWRWQRNRSERKGWQYEKLLPPHNGMTLQALRAVSDAWLQEGSKTEQGFALGYFDEDYLQRCDIHALRDDTGRVVAFANQLPVFAGLHQASVDLIRHVPNADGAMPSLLQHVIASLQDSGFQTFDLGFVPLAGLEGEVAKLVRRIGRNRFSAAGLEQFKNKFEPTWHPDYIAYDGDLIDLARIAASLERVLKLDKNLSKSVE
jgi:phosphatidylglycerol lysyltransferase